MIVMKFGGSTLRDADGVRRAGALVRDRIARRPLLVVSALGDTTDRLGDLLRREADAETGVARIRDRHAGMLSDLGLDTTLLDAEWERLTAALQEVCTTGPEDATARDAVLATGERLACRVVAAHLAARGVPARPVDADALGLEMSGDPPADVAPGVMEELGKTLLGGRVVQVVTGFIARDGGGRIRTLGRNGSDLSAAILACAVDADEIQIWTDVDGVMTCDPRDSAEARLIPTLTYEEATRMAEAGRTRLHPQALHRAARAGIPIHIRNAAQPTRHGTVVSTASVTGPVKREP